MKMIELRKTNITDCGDIITKVVVLKPTEKGTTKVTTGSIDGCVEWKDHVLRWIYMMQQIASSQKDIDYIMQSSIIEKLKIERGIENERI